MSNAREVAHVVSLSMLTRVLGLVGLLLVCTIFYATRGDVTPPMYSSFCVDEQGELYSLGAHHRRNPKGQLLECTETGWASVSDVACGDSIASASGSPQTESGHDRK